MLKKKESGRNLYLSKIPTGTVLPARHYYSKLPNKVKVGKIAVSRTERDTIHQPLYLRQGYGLFLRKYSRPRREHYGPEDPERLQFIGSECEDYSRSLKRVLCTEGVIMTNHPITSPELDPQFRALAATPLPLSELKAIEAAVAKDPDLIKIVHRDPNSRRMLAPLLPSHGILYADQDEKMEPPPFFIPPAPLPDPVIQESGGEDSSGKFIYFTDKPLLRKPELPSIKGALRTEPTSPSPSLASMMAATSTGSQASSADLTEEQRMEAWKRSKQDQALVWPMFVPHVVLPSKAAADTATTASVTTTAATTTTSSASGTGSSTAAHCLEITSAREQEGLVDLEDMFPYGAEKGLMEEINFYQRKNFPLLLKRNPKVNAEEYKNLHSARMLPPERVTRVDYLCRRVTRQQLEAREIKRTDSDLDDTETCILDEVFDPSSYSFNQPVYKDIKKLSKDKKL